MNYRLLNFSFIIFLVWSCRENQPQKPTEYTQDGFLEYSKEYNKNLKITEEKKIENYIKKSALSFEKAKNGIYMSLISHNESNNDKSGDLNVKDGDQVEFTYSVKNLDDAIIYSSEEIGNKKIILGRSLLPIGMEYAIKNMHQGDRSIFILPSSLAYGLQGDGDKIKADQILIFKLHLKKIINQ